MTCKICGVEGHASWCERNTDYLFSDEIYVTQTGCNCHGCPYFTSRKSEVYYEEID